MKLLRNAPFPVPASRTLPLTFFQNAPALVAFFASPVSATAMTSSSINSIAMKAASTQLHQKQHDYFTKQELASSSSRHNFRNDALFFHKKIEQAILPPLKKINSRCRRNNDKKKYDGRKNIRLYQLPITNKKTTPVPSTITTTARSVIRQGRHQWDIPVEDTIASAWLDNMLPMLVPPPAYLLIKGKNRPVPLIIATKKRNKNNVAANMKQDARVIAERRPEKSNKKSQQRQRRHFQQDADPICNRRCHNNDIPVVVVTKYQHANDDDAVSVLYDDPNVDDQDTLPDATIDVLKYIFDDILDYATYSDIDDTTSETSV